MTDDTEHFTLLNGETDIAQSPKLFAVAVAMIQLANTEHGVGRQVPRSFAHQTSRSREKVPDLTETVGFGKMFNGDGCWHNEIYDLRLMI